MTNILELIPKIRKGRKARAVKGLWAGDKADWDNGSLRITDKKGNLVTKELTDGMLDGDWELISLDWKTCTQDEVWDLPGDIVLETQDDASAWIRIWCSRNCGVTRLIDGAGDRIPIARGRRFRWREKE